MSTYVDLRVTGNEEDLKSFLRLCATIDALCRMGCSRRIPVEVDGDGSADLSFALLRDGVDFQPLRLGESPDVTSHEVATIYIGE